MWEADQNADQNAEHDADRDGSVVGTTTRATEAVAVAGERERVRAVMVGSACPGGHDG